MKIQTKAECPNCLRVIDLLNDIDAEDWFAGHDCEECECEECQW